MRRLGASVIDHFCDEDAARVRAGFAVKPAVMVAPWTLAELQSISACSSPPLLTRPRLPAPL